MKILRFIRTNRAPFLCALAALALVVGGVVFMVLSTPARSVEPAFQRYSERYAGALQNVDSGTRVNRESDYYIATSSEFAIPANGSLLINPSEKEVIDSALIFASDSPDQITDWSDRASLYLLDGAHTNHAAALLPGVNILNESDEQGVAGGVLYTNRQLAIGALPRMWQDEPALVALEDAASHGQLENIEALRMDVSQRITGTDLIFAAPGNKGVSSFIQAPVADHKPGNSFTLEGGVISIDSGATLNIGSGEIGTANPLQCGSASDDTGSATTSEAGEASAATGESKTASEPIEGTITLSPRAIIVDGGTLILSDTTKEGITINAPIQVRNGGTLLIGENVVINGNIYVFGGGRVEVKGNFTLNGKPVPLALGADLAHPEQVNSLIAGAAETGEQIPGGIFIFADNTLSANDIPLGAGFFSAQTLWAIEGSNGIDELIRSQAVHFFTTEAAPAYPFMYRDYCCQDASSPARVCEHLGQSHNEQAPETRIGFSDDGALIEIIAPKDAETSSA